MQKTALLAMMPTLWALTSPTLFKFVMEPKHLEVTVEFCRKVFSRCNREEIIASVVLALVAIYDHLKHYTHKVERSVQ